MNIGDLFVFWLLSLLQDIAIIPRTIQELF